MRALLASAPDMFATSSRCACVPVSEPRFTIVEVATGLEMATFESQAEAVAALAFPGLGPDEAEIVSDNVAALAAW